MVGLISEASAGDGGVPFVYEEEDFVVGEGWDEADRDVVEGDG